MEYFTFVAEKEDVNSRLDVFLTEIMDGITRNSVQNLIEKGNVCVNSIRLSKNYRLKPSDIIEVIIPEPVQTEILPENIPLNILYEDKDIIVVDKPQNMVVHPSAGHYSGTLVNALLYHCSGNLSGINGELRPGIVHRIDKDTSGALLAAKNDNAHRSLSLQFAKHSIKRVYNAIVFDNLKQDTGTIDAPIGRSPHDRKKMAVSHANSKNAVTHYKVLERFGKYTFIEAQLETGRTHQIRVHMSHIGHPVLGDEVYSARKQPFNLCGQVLHAKTLGFVHPGTNEYIELNSDLPNYYKDLLEKFRRAYGF